MYDIQKMICQELLSNPLTKSALYEIGFDEGKGALGVRTRSDTPWIPMVQ